MCSIYSSALALPPHKLSTKELIEHLDKKVNTTITSRIKNLGVDTRYTIVKDYAEVLTGTKERVLSISATDLALEAVNNCFAKSNVCYDEISIVLTLTNTTNQRLPCFGYELLEREPRISRNANIVNMENQGCSALLKAIDLAHGWTQTNGGKALIVSSDTPTGFFENVVNQPLLDYKQMESLSPFEKKNAQKDLNTLIAASLFGDGASAMIIGEEARDLPKIGLYNHLTNVDSLDLQLLSMNEGGILAPKYSGMPKYHMSKQVRERGAYYADRVLEPALSDINHYQHRIKSDHEKFLLCHTGSRRILEGVQSNMNNNNFKMELSYEVLRKFGNLSGSSLGFMLDHAIREHPLQTGVIVGFGVGFSASSAIVDTRCA